MTQLFCGNLLILHLIRIHHLPRPFDEKALTNRLYWINKVYIGGIMNLGWIAEIYLISNKEK